MKCSGGCGFVSVHIIHAAAVIHANEIHKHGPGTGFIGSLAVSFDVFIAVQTLTDLAEANFALRICVYLVLSVWHSGAALGINRGLFALLSLQYEQVPSQVRFLFLPTLNITLTPHSRIQHTYQHNV